MDPKISIVILAWNGEAFLEACLMSVLEQAHAGVEVIVVDNASTDQSVAVVERHCPPVRLIRSPINRGFSGGCNLGLRAAQGEILVLLNQDTQVAPGWLDALLAAFAAQTEAGIVGCKTLYPDSRRLQHAGGWVEWPLGYAHHFGYQEIDQGQWDTPREVEFVTGAAMAFRRVLLERIGLLDERFWPGYLEDLDYCLRAAAAGFAVWYWPAAILFHHESPSTNPASRSRYYQRGRLRLVLKHTPPARFLSDFVPAEAAAQAGATMAGEGRGLRLAYLDTLPDLPALFREVWQADVDSIEAGIAAMQSLYARAWETELKLMHGLEAAALPDRESVKPSPELEVEPQTESPLPISPNLMTEYVEVVRGRHGDAPPSDAAWLDFREYQFHSSIPVVGAWLARLRGWWHGLAARWAVLYLMQQQEAINRRQEDINRRQEAISRRQDAYGTAIGQRLLDLAEENALLAARLAKLRLDRDKVEADR